MRGLEGGKKCAAQRSCAAALPLNGHCNACEPHARRLKRVIAAPSLSGAAATKELHSREVMHVKSDARLSGGRSGRAPTPPPALLATTTTAAAAAANAPAINATDEPKASRGVNVVVRKSASLVPENKTQKVNLSSDEHNTSNEENNNNNNIIALTPIIHLHTQKSETKFDSTLRIVLIVI